MIRGYNMKRILLLGTGGTIACKRTDKGLKPVITSDEILSYVPDSRSYCEIHSIQLMNIDSTNIQPCHWLAVERQSRKTTANTTALSSPTARTPWLIRPRPCPT